MPTKFLTSAKDTYSFGGGANTIEVAADSASQVVGYTVELGGGDDLATLAAGNDVVFGEGGSDTIIGGTGNDTLYGDVVGDTTSRTTEIDTMYGDASGAISASGYAFGDDIITGASGSANFTNRIYGDAEAITGASTGGDDVLTGGNLAANTIYGDAHDILGNGAAGDDLLTGGLNAINEMYGDASSLQATTVSLTGGNDTIQGGASSSNTLYGDGLFMGSQNGWTATGGNDVLTASNGGTNIMYGDAASAATNYIVDGLAVIGGDDTLVSGTGNDRMYGDFQVIPTDSMVIGGADTFVFLSGSGDDTIGDFGANDVIDVSALGITGLGGLSSNPVDADGDQFADDTLIDIGGGDSITLLNYSTALDSGDFIFSI